MAASATFALKPGVWFRRGRLLMVSPDQVVTVWLSGGTEGEVYVLQCAIRSNRTGPDEHLEQMVHVRVRTRR